MGTETETVFKDVNGQDITHIIPFMTSYEVIRTTVFRRGDSVMEIRHHVDLNRPVGYL